MASNKKEKDNFECILEIMNVPVMEGLREVFKQEWDKQYGATKGLWDDTCISGNELFNMEGSIRAAKTFLPVFRSGRRADWDCSALSYAILYSTALQPYIPAHVRNNVDALRILRNNLAHVISTQHKLSDVAFENVYRKIKQSFIALSLPTADIEKVRKSRNKRHGSICTARSILVMTIVFLATSWLLAKIIFRNKLYFTVLPPNPGHAIVNRSQIVDGILDELRILSSRNNRALTYLYISGPQGSGRSQMARLVGQQYLGDSTSGWFGDISFVMTIDGRSILHVLNSYVELAYRLNCTENDVDRIFFSNQSTGEKVKKVLLEIEKKLDVNTKITCLIIVLNVLKLDEIVPFLPSIKDESWQGGQVLITTQNISVPPNDSSSVHVSVRQGMHPTESITLLTDLSGLFEHRDLVSEVAKELDHQPLALVSAALYMKKRRDKKMQITWKGYLRELDQEKRNLAKMKQGEYTNAFFSTMYAAVSLAIRWIGENDSVMKHAFTFFSFLSHEPLPLSSVGAFTQHIDRGAYSTYEKIEECSLFLSSEHGELVLISLNSIVHTIINLYISNYVEKDENLPRIVLQFLVLPGSSFLNLYYVPHLKSFYKEASSLPTRTRAGPKAKGFEI
ncbi:uncharacterized protein LOC114540131 isoform X1 [Dendronephthya gigantea]|uniref:uncharacterized protein LOC114540131 isoform X1 n=1 Tax=Dendronephthya gigantea TaxID=151771 RepID=UPI00106B2447|nr:uncharacterized protein LOC114540131 isoform X1 [Dendronephthya gigantea]XP_028416214.1 uncharacterized protein LOC114540131 isoform X1 [Dendronephthya gigantea]